MEPLTLGLPKSRTIIIQEHGHVIAVPIIIGYHDEVGIVANIILHQDW
jgi:hypothetical protein